MNDGERASMADETARIPLPGPEMLSPAQRTVFEAVVSGRRGTLIGPLRAALHNADLADRWQKLGELLRYNTVFPPLYSELAVLLTARRWNSELEWIVHADAARAAGMAEDAIDAIRDGRMPSFDDPDLRTIYDYVAALQMSGQVSDAEHAAVVERWGVVGVVELTAITGYYAMVAMTLNAHRIPLPDDFAPALYPDGQTPPDRLSDLPRSPSRPSDTGAS